MLFGVKPLDGVTFVSATLLLAVTALLAMIGPAWRATRVDPAIALRTE
jgi:putative ABC transport system permease protein